MAFLLPDHRKNRRENSISSQKRCSYQEAHQSRSTSKSKHIKVKAHQPSKRLLTTREMDSTMINTEQEKQPPLLAQQSAFCDELIKASNAAHSERPDCLWCLIRGRCEAERIQTTRLFLHELGQATIDAIYGRKRCAELFSPKNGLLISVFIQRYIDAGKIVIVPDVPDRSPGCLGLSDYRWIWTLRSASSTANGISWIR
ncbi:hypothetical protein BDW74DRAFT_179241 [Aspergillus multicolor]|uniref:uncharacterized protein n=1 Tax=Aspergillus multicolor TaxID=41759 RepID=UPI003CCD4823